MSSNPVLEAFARLEAAIERLEGALARKRAQAARPNPGNSTEDEAGSAGDDAWADYHPSESDGELQRLRAENAELAFAADTVSSRLEKTIERLKTLLDA